MIRPRSIVSVARGIALTAALGQLSCVAVDDADLRPPPGYSPPTFRPLHRPESLGARAFYGDGFFPLEAGVGGTTWHWMPERGTIYLPNDHRDKQLHLAGWVPLELLAKAPTVSVALNGVELDRFVVSEGHFVRDYGVAAARLRDARAAQLTIETSATGYAPGDSRKLGVSINALGWHDDPTAQTKALAGATSAR